MGNKDLVRFPSVELVGMHDKEHSEGLVTAYNQKEELAKAMGFMWASQPAG